MKISLLMETRKTFVLNHTRDFFPKLSSVAIAFHRTFSHGTDILLLAFRFSHFEVLKRSPTNQITVVQSFCLRN